MPEFSLDCKGQQCPKPIVQISRRMADLSSGDTLRVEATDPAFRADVEAWVTLRGEMLIDLRADGEVAAVTLQKR